MASHHELPRKRAHYNIHILGHMMDVGLSAAAYVAVCSALDIHLSIRLFDSRICLPLSGWPGSMAERFDLCSVSAREEVISVYIYVCMRSLHDGGILFFFFLRRVLFFLVLFFLAPSFFLSIPLFFFLFLVHSFFSSFSRMLWSGRCGWAAGRTQAVKAFAPLPPLLNRKGLGVFHGNLKEEKKKD